MLLSGMSDRWNLPRIYVAEHSARSVLHVIREVRKNPKPVDFDGLEVYMGHLPGRLALLQTLKGDACVQDA